MSCCLLGNCIAGCKHDKVKEIFLDIEEKDENGRVWMTGKEFAGHQHYCDKNPHGYDAWHEKHEHEKVDTLLKINDDNAMDCYEPTETHELATSMISKLDELIELTKNKKN